MEFSKNIVVGGGKKEYCKCGPAMGLSCWVYNVLDDIYLTRSSSLMVSKADSRAGDLCSFPRRRDPHLTYCVASLKKQGGRSRRTNFVIWVAGSVLSASTWMSMAWREVLYG